MARISWAFAFACASTRAAAALDWTATPFSPPSYPLAVRTPYLSAWLPQGAGTPLNGAWPQFWTGSTLGWSGFVNVDGASYSFLGKPVVQGANFKLAVQKSATFTSTQSEFVLSAGGIDITATFLSPVEPEDLVKQSTPLSYLAVSANSNDNQQHKVQIYTDISAEWVTGDNSLKANWTTTTGDVLTHQIQLQEQTLFGESQEHIQQGAAYYSTKNTNGTTYQTGPDVDVRAQFIKNGKLANSKDGKFRAVQDNWPVFGLAQDLGTVKDASTPVVFAVGHVRDPVINYMTQGGKLQPRSSYFWSKYSSVHAMISEFLGDYPSALDRAKKLDSKISTDGSKISADYAALLALSVRQSFGGTEVTISKKSDGSWNTEDTTVFMKEISSDGNVNTVDVIFPAWPIFNVMAPAFCKYLLLPLFEYQATGQYPHKWSVHDMGTHYPVANGHNDGSGEEMQVEESGNMLIMTLSYTLKTNDTSLIKTYTGLLDQWTQFLIQDSLIPAKQLSTDDFAGPLTNQTNLAIKGMIGIKAMSVIQGLLGDKDKASNYSNIASNYVEQWQKLATSSTGKHLKLDYQDDNSWGLTYNLWADKHLKTELFPGSIYEEQTAWYKTVQQAYGVPLDTRHAKTWTKTDWQILTAGTVTDKDTRDFLVSSVVKYAKDGKNSVPLSDWYDASTGTQNGFKARPVVGGHFALLAL